jgi:hypothetical protein
MYVQIGWEVGAHVQLLMNELFGEDCLQNLIIYNYGKFHHSKERWKRDFDIILFYSKNPRRWTFNHDAVMDAYREVVQFADERGGGGRVSDAEDGRTLNKDYRRFVKS